MDSLLILKRPIKAVKSNKRIKLVRSKKLWPAPSVKLAKKEEHFGRKTRPSCESMSEDPRLVAATEHVSFVSLYRDLCREYYESSDCELPPSGVSTILSAGDHARRAHAQVVLEIDY